MDKLDESRRCKWSTSATNLLVSIWSHDMVQNRLKLSSRNQPIWQSIARYMGTKGFNVTGIQCRTRIKNMLCTYYEAVRKKDPSYIEPYFDLFKKIVTNKGPKKKDFCKKLNKRNLLEEIDDLDASSGLSQDIEKPIEKRTTSELTYEMEYLDVRNQEVQVNTFLADGEMISTLERILTKAIDAQAKMISEAIKYQSDIVEKLLALERQKIEEILLIEQESRKKFEEKLDKFYARLVTNSVPQTICKRPKSEPRQN